MLTILAAADIHISLKAEKLFDIGPFAVTNSMLYGLLCAIFIAIVMRVAARNIKVRPAKGFSALIEIMVDYITNLLTGPFGSRQKALKFVPIFGVYFVFIMFNNLLGLLPVVGPGIEYSGVPIFRPFTADINGTIAMAVIAVLMVQYLSIREQGGKKHLQHYFTNKPFNPINFFIGILEVLGEFTRIMSLSLRLFLNTAVGEILIAVFTSMIIASGRTPIAVIPIFLFEGLVAYIQAYVFTVLAGTYLGMAIAHSDHDEHDGHSDDSGKKLALEPESDFVGEESHRGVSVIRRGRTTAKKLLYGQEASGSQALLGNKQAGASFLKDHHSPAKLVNQPAGFDG